MSWIIEDNHVLSNSIHIQLQLRLIWYDIHVVRLWRLWVLQIIILEIQPKETPNKKPKTFAKPPAGINVLNSHPLFLQESGGCLVGLCIPLHLRTVEEAKDFYQMINHIGRGENIGA